MTRANPSHPVLAAMLALALLVGLALPASAAPATEVGTRELLSVASPEIAADSLAAIDVPSHHFGFSSVLSQQAATAFTITKSDSPDPVAPGSNITYSIPVTNSTSPAGTVTNLTVTDNLQSGLTLAQVPTISGGTGGACTGVVGGTTATCTLTSLAAGATATVTIVALVPASTANGTVVHNSATVTGTAGTTSQTATSNAASTTVTSGALSPLTIAKTGSPSTVNLGGTLTYTVTVTNPSTTVANGVTVTDNLTGNVAFVSATSTVGSCTGSTGVTTVTCNVGTLTAGQSATITILVTVPPAACGNTIGLGGGFGGQGLFGQGGFGGQGLFGQGGFGQGGFGGQSSTSTVTLTNTASATGTGLATVTSSAVSTSVTCLPSIFPPNLPLLPPPPLEFIPPPPPPLLPPPPPAPTGAMAPRAAFPEVPVIPEADSLFLVVGGLVALGGLVGYRRLRRRDDDNA